MEKKAVIISYSFPPYGSVAGRRWFLFAKQLSDKFDDIEIIAARGTKATSPWDSKEMKVSYLRDGYPKVLKQNPQSILGKLKYRLALFLVKKSYPGTPYDYGIYWINEVKKQLGKLGPLKNRHVFVTGAPFSSFSLVNYLKYNGAITYIDFRDPYSWGVGYGMQSIEYKRLDFERRQEKAAIEDAHSVLLPNKQMAKDLLTLYPWAKNKVKVLPHPIDQVNINSKFKAGVHKKDSIQMVYAGTLYQDATKEWKQVLNWLCQNSDLSLVIYSESSLVDKDLISEINKHSQVELRAPISSKRLFQEMLSFDAYMIVSPSRVKNFVSTKYPDLVLFGIPLVVYSEEGGLASALSTLKQVKVINDFSQLGSFNLKQWLVNITPDADSHEITTFLETHSGRIKDVFFTA